MEQYDPKNIEPKWQKKWEEAGAFAAREPVGAHPDIHPSPQPSPREGRGGNPRKFYGLIEFPYPSGEGLHTGHVRSNTAMDVIARKRRAEGFEVLYPIGWDAFGLPTENFSIKTGKHPIQVTKNNTDTFRRQLKALGFSFDWSREINTTDPAYYKWTQWIFLQMYKKGLAYKSKTLINWCPKCKIGLANEEAAGGVCERCGGVTEKREKEQWMLAITKYAQRLYDDLDTVDYIERAKVQQRNWIGPSEGAEISFEVVANQNPPHPNPLPGKGEGAAQDPSLNSSSSPIPGRGCPTGQVRGVEGSEKITVFTTRPDTLFGATYVVVAPEYPMISEWAKRCENAAEIRAYVASAAAKEDMERTADQKEKTGVELKGIRAINPATKEEVPVWVADYVLGSYGTGAVMAVPAHDERDFAFAKKFELPIVEVVQGGNVSAEAYAGDGTLTNSAEFSGLSNEDAKKKITDFAGGKMVTKFKLRDWVFSRQRYWGEPIPMVKCEKDGWVPVPEDQLPVVLPNVEKYQPMDNGESPLAALTDWVKTTCPTCGGEAKRETDVMPNWAGSSWYYLRYCDPKNDTALAGADALKYWTPVDWYNGGMEHTTLHLLYSRFWHKFLFDIGAVPTSEPYAKRTSNGLILAGDGTKMSKSKGNVVNPNTVVEPYGADALRLYEMFMGPFEQDIAWSTDGVVGVRRFIERVWKLQERVTEEDVVALAAPLQKTIKKVSEDIEAMKFNTAVSQMMIFLNLVDDAGSIGRAQLKVLVQLLAPFTPHVAEELWECLGGEGLVHSAPWPMFNEKLLAGEPACIIIQVNGKARGVVEAPRGTTEAEVVERAQKVAAARLADKTIHRTIFIPDRLINFVLAE